MTLKNIKKIKHKLPVVFCLYHQHTNCICIKPIVEQSKLIERLESQIKLYKIQRSLYSETEKANLEEKIKALEVRLNDEKAKTDSVTK